MKNGTKKVQYPDGTFKIVLKDGREEYVTPSRKDWWTPPTNSSVPEPVRAASAHRDDVADLHTYNE